MSKKLRMCQYCLQLNDSAAVSCNACHMQFDPLNQPNTLNNKNEDSEMKNMETHLIFKDCKTVSECEEKLNALIESWPVVYGTVNDIGFKGSHPYMNSPINTDTHKARLAFVEEIVKIPCEHEPEISYSINGEAYGEMSGIANCRHCGVELKLKATWSEK